MSDKPKGSPPERKIKPLGVSGLSVNVWINTIQTAEGPKQARSITVSPTRYRDPKTKEWKDSPFFRPDEVPALIWALQKALDHTYSTPIPDGGSP